MAIKGNGYTKTSWSFQERPVASAKLNLWDDRIEDALELAYYLLNLAWGGGSGVLRGATAYDLKVVAKSPESMSVEVKSGYAFISKMPYKLEVAASLTFSSIPTTYPRIDIVQAKLDGWGLSIRSGTEAAVPQVPVANVDSIILAQVFLRPGMTCIKEGDDGVNGYIVDMRQFL